MPQSIGCGSVSPPPAGRLTKGAGRRNRRISHDITMVKKNHFSMTKTMNSRHAVSHGRAVSAIGRFCVAKCGAAARPGKERSSIQQMNKSAEYLQYIGSTFCRNNYFHICSFDATCLPIRRAQIAGHCKVFYNANVKRIQFRSITSLDPGVAYSARACAALK